jgi:hypothetical protein
VSIPITDIVDLVSNSTTGKLYTGQPTRYGFVAEPFFVANSGDGISHVDTPFAIKWYGSAGTNTNTGPITSGSYQIGDIQFLNSAGANVNIASGITWPTIATPSTAPAAPSLSASSVDCLFNSSATYTDVNMADWQASWSTNATMVQDSTTVSGKTLLKLAFTDPNGYDGADIATPLNISTLTKHLHFDYWTPNATALEIKVVDFAPSGTYGSGNITGIYTVTPVQNSWQSVNIDLTSGSTPLTDFQYIAQLVFTGNVGAANQNFWIDNVYFY